MFLVFAWDQYYPTGGFNDFLGECETLEQALAMATHRPRERYQIVERFNGGWVVREESP